MGQGEPESPAAETDAGPANPESPPEAGAADPQAQPAPSESSQSVTEQELSPKARLIAAQQAFREGDFGRISSLLLPVLEPEALLETRKERNLARQILGAGLFFQAQSATANSERAALLDKTEFHFLEALREEPQLTLDRLIYPASVVDLFEKVRAANATELDALIRMDKGTDENNEMKTVYVERQVQKNTYVLNFVPFGIGQFQNGDQIKGTVFALTQAMALGLNITSYLMIESLRGESGYYTVGDDPNSSEFADALAWQRVMYGSLAAFAALYAGSVIDALINYDEERVFIRALDAPPVELRSSGEDASLSPALPIGWSVGIRW